MFGHILVPTVAALTLWSSAAFCAEAAPAAKMTFDWPEGIQGCYSVHGRTGWENKGRSIELGDGTYRLIGSGFDAKFDVKAGVVTFEPPPGLGISFDRRTNTFGFTAATIALRLNRLSTPVQIPRVTGWLHGVESYKVTLVYSRQHRLDTVGGSIRFAVDPQGNVSLPEHPAGFAAAGSELIVLPRAFAFQPGCEGQWHIERDAESWQQGNGLRNLVPTGLARCYRLLLKPGGKAALQTDFYLNREFRVSLRPDQDYADFLEIPLAGADGKPGTFVIRLADFDLAAWKTRESTRRAAAKAAGDKLAAALSRTSWQMEFVLTDFMQIYDFPEELVSYPVEFPGGKVRAEDLSLLAAHGEFLQPAAFQLCDAVSERGYLKRATVCFRTDLPRHATRRYKLVCGLGQQGRPATTWAGVKEEGNGQAVLTANLLRVKVPCGRMEFAGGRPLAEVPAPILTVSRAGAPDQWVGRGSFSAPNSVKAVSLRAGPVLEGPLVCQYRVAYGLIGGGSYTAVLTLQHNEKHVTIDEYLQGLRPEDDAFLKLDLVPGLDPDRREVQSNGGYQQYSGEFTAPAGGFLPHGTGASLKGKLPYELGLNTPNNYGIMRATAFYKDRGEHAVLLALYRIRDWKTARRMVWYDTWGQGNLMFFGDEGRKYMLAGLQGRQRHWALGLIPRKEMIHMSVTESTYHAGPETRLWQKLSDFSLNKVKDMCFAWDEPPARRLAEIGKEVSYEQWLTENGLRARLSGFLDCIVNAYWDYSSTAGPVSFRAMPRWFGDYDASRAGWTPAQRQHVRAILVWMAHSCEDDNNLPHHSMLAGHPNFIMDVKQTLPLACAVLAKHPHAPQWRDSFMQYYTRWLETYQRKADPKHNAIGGRWTENIACYSGTSLKSVLHSHLALESYDGTDLLNHPRLRAWVHWYLNALMSPHWGTRLVPPEGAHVWAFEPGNSHGYYDVLFEIAERMKNSAPELSARMRWIHSNGKEGPKPELKSVLVADHGPVLRHDFGGPREAYVHLTQISGKWNYRWGGGHSMLYYGAKNQIWSYNTTEEAGDQWNLNNVTSFTVEGQGLGRHPTDQPLYDFDFAQFYRAPGSPESKYLSRAIMLLRDDYLVLYDDVQGDAEGQFVWASVFTMPIICQLKPGVSFTADASTDTKPLRRGEPPARTNKIHRYRGKGDFLTLVAPALLSARAMKFGAVVNGDEYVFCGDTSISHADEKTATVFEGTCGYARTSQLALFEGTKIGQGGFVLRREGGDFGASAEATAGQIVGRVAGRAGGRVFVTPPEGLPARRASVQVDGRPVAVTINADEIGFEVAVSQAEGYKSYAVVLDRSPSRKTE